MVHECDARHRHSRIMCLRVQRLLLLLGAGLVLVAAAPAPTPKLPQPLDPTTVVASPSETPAPRDKRGIIYQTHGYPGLVYPSLTYPFGYPGYFDLRYPAFTYPSYPTLTGYPGYPVFIG